MKKLTSRVIAGGLGIATAAEMALAAPEAGHHGHHMMWGGGWLLGPLMMVLFVALIVGAAVLVLRTLGYGPARSSTDKSIEILRERFARGEIDKDEFAERMNILKS